MQERLVDEAGSAAGRKTIGGVGLLPPSSPIQQATDDFTLWVRRYRRVSFLQFFLPHGIIGVLWSSIWLCRTVYESDDADDYFSRMVILRSWVLRAQGLRYNIRLAVLVSALFVIAPAVFLPVFLGAVLSKENPNVGRIFEVCVPLVCIFFVSAIHVAIAAIRVLPAAAAFVAAATPSLEARLLTRDESARFVSESLSAERTASALGISRFVGHPSLLMTGQAVEAVRGLPHFLRVPEIHVLKGIVQIYPESCSCSLHPEPQPNSSTLCFLTGLVEGTAAIVREVEAFGEPALTRALHAYGLCEQGDIRLDEYVKHSRAVAAGLREAHIVSIRLYTSADGFAYFNDPMRDRDRYDADRAHPLAVTMAFLADGVRKLRLEYMSMPESSGDGRGATVLYRGLRGVTIGIDFMLGRMGGTELAAMSTTSSWAVAVGFVLQQTDGPPLPASQSIVLRILVANAVQYGADVAWLSVNPAEFEVIFPPLCYLQPTGRFEIVRADGGAQVTVVEVVPFV